MPKIITCFEDLIELGFSVGNPPNAAIIELQQRDNIKEVKQLRAFLSKISGKPVLVVPFDVGDRDTWEETLNQLKVLVSDKQFIFESQLNVKRLVTALVETDPVKVEKVPHDNNFIESLVSMDIFKNRKGNVDSFGVFPRNMTIWYYTGNFSVLVHLDIVKQDEK